MVTKALKLNPIKGGEAGRNRLSVIADVWRPPPPANLALARHVGPEGHVTALDLDEEKLVLARADAEAQGIAMSLSKQPM